MSGSEHSESQSTLTVGFVAGVAPDKWARVWAERMPDVALRLRPLDPDRVLDAFDDGVEMAFARLPLADGDRELRSIGLWEETPVVVVPKDHPIKLFDAVTLADLADENVLDGDDDATLDLVAAGVGVARMPQSVLRANGRRDVIGRPVSDAEPTRIALVWPVDADGSRESMQEIISEFIGVVRGRTAQSSRGVVETPLRPVEKARQKAAAQRAADQKAAAKKPSSGQKPPKGRPQARRGGPRRGR